MTTALVALAVCQPLVVGAFVWLLKQQNDRMWREVQVLMNRIQAPETAVTQTLVPDEQELGPPDTEWQEAAAHARMMDTFTEGD